MIFHLAGWIMPFIILLPILTGVVRSESSKKRRYFLSCFIVTASAFLHIFLHLILGFGEAFVHGVDTGRIVAWIFIDAFMLLISILFINQQKPSEDLED